jgi:hypothetical protein
MENDAFVNERPLPLSHFPPQQTGNIRKHGFILHGGLDSADCTNPSEAIFKWKATTTLVASTTLKEHNREVWKTPEGKDSSSLPLNSIPKNIQKTPPPQTLANNFLHYEYGTQKR